MTVIIYKCARCGEALEGTEDELACSFRDGLTPEWECIQCKCGDLLAPLVTSSTKRPIARFLAQRYKEAAQEAGLVQAHLELEHLVPWKINQKKGASNKHWVVELEGWRLDYWPGHDQFRYTPVEDWTSGADRRDGGFDFVKRTLDDYQLRQASRKS